jgi:hypothetical protein
MLRPIFKQGISALMMVVAMVTGGIITRLAIPNGADPNSSQSTPFADVQQQQEPTASPTPSETIPPNTPLATLTPSQTLKPPPTFEPPTQTPQPSLTPTITLTPTILVDVSIPGLHGAETPTPSTTPGCVPREDWQLTYTVKRDDSLARIAEMYGTYIDELVKANCIKDRNLIVIGQVVRVPGDAPPQQAVVCDAWEALTPFNGSVTVPADGQITFNWRGPQAPKYLIRIHRPDGTMYERLVELRQNEVINASEHLRQAGTYTWYIYPLGNDFLQIPCREGGPYQFAKDAAAGP